VAVDDAWEYQVATLGREEVDALNRLGREGWELVGVVPGGRPASPTFYFKRRAPTFRERVTLDQKERYYRQWGHPSRQDERADG